MNDLGLAWIFVAETTLLGIVAIFIPRITRRGLLFGVYVGEAAYDAEDARAIKRAWSIGMTAATAACVIAAIVLATTSVHPMIAIVPELALLAIGAALYVRAYRAARDLARVLPGLPPPPPEIAEPRSGTMLPWAVIALSIVASAWLTANAASHYNGLPERIPIHFNASGQADGFAAKSFGSVFALSLMTGLLGLFIGGIAVLVARTRPALRSGDRGGASIAAQARFRAATARFLAGTGLLVVAMLASMAVFSLRVAEGMAPGLPSKFLLLVFAILAWTFGGVIYLLVRYGQGGARLEGATSAPLADGLADNRRWWGGVIYVNREDPAWLVEKRFGVGYTINFGNPKAVGALVAFLVAMMALAVLAAR